MEIDSSFGQMMTQTFGSFDLGGFGLFAAMHNDFMTFVSHIFSSCGSTIFCFLLCFLALFLCMFKKTRKLGICILIVIPLTALTSKYILNPVFGRIRPYNALQSNSQYFSWYLEVGGVPESSYSFPSKHAAGAFALAVVIFYYVKSEIKSNYAWLAFILPVFIGCSRIYFMVHYPTDVIFGAIIGIVFGLIAVGLYNLFCLVIKKYNNFFKVIDNFDLYKYLIQKKHICITKQKVIAFFILAPICCLIISFAYQMYDINGGAEVCSYRGKDYICMNKAANKSVNPEGEIEYYCDLHFD